MTPPKAPDPSTYKGIKGPLRHRCPLCAAVGSKLLRCTGCHAFRYCSREHQVAHRPEHKSACTKIKRGRAKLADEDYAVRNAQEDFLTPANAFETDVGHFWGILNTRDYMRARFTLAKSLLMLGTLDGVSEALEHLLDMLRLCRGDNMGLRSIVPAIMLRLDLDQECYDFIKWWATCDPDGYYDWGDMSLPYLNIHGANVLEKLGPLAGVIKRCELNHLIALLILKLKLLVDVRDLKITRMILPQRLPLELQEQIERDVLRSPLSVNFLRESPESLTKIQRKLVTQVCRIGEAIFEEDTDFMFALFDPDKALSIPPDLYALGSAEETAFAMQNSYAAWWETEGVLELLDEARTCAARASEDEAKDLRELMKLPEGQTDEESLDYLSVSQVFESLDFAVENFLYLGPWSQRPSERHLKDVQGWETEDSEYEGSEDSSSDSAGSDAKD
ncbi:hypothetical protein GGS21DRAFT_528265 [Xylaria nigripes]|nr:hypothetical protein GGS21DRAFT_528265 [Xylaria nigripes]